MKNKSIERRKDLQEVQAILFFASFAELFGSRIEI